MLVTPHPYWGNTPVVSPDSDTNGLIPTQDAIPRRLYPVIDGEVLASCTTTVSARRIPVREPKRSFLRQSLDDPSWILMILAIILGVSITATTLYGLIEITLAVGRWFTTNGTTLAILAALIVLLVLCGGTTAAKCAGLHCGGCQR
jgi:hypothetical protein